MKGYFFNAQPTDDIIAHPSGWDREYDALDYNTCTAIFYENGIFANRDPNACKVTASGLVLTVAPGVALINGGQCHFEAGDGVTLTDGDGKYSLMCRKNNAAEVRAFELIALHHVTEFPAPVRAGDIYDLCLSHVTVAGGTVSIVDTRANIALCGFAALAAMPPYYPPDSSNLPYVLWLYTLGLPMSPEQVTAVESNPSLMAIVNASKTRAASTQAAGIVKLSSAIDSDSETEAATAKAVKTAAVFSDHKVGDYIYTRRTNMPSNFVYLNGAKYTANAIPELSNVLPYDAVGIQPWSPSSGDYNAAGISICGEYAFVGGGLRGYPNKYIYRKKLSETAIATGWDNVYNFNGALNTTTPLNAPRDFIFNPITGDYSCLVESRIHYSPNGFQTGNGSVTPAYTPVTIAYNNGKVWLASATGLYSTPDVRTNSWTLALAGDIRSLSVVNGRLIACVYGYVATKYSLAWSDDNGQTWTYSSSSSTNGVGFASNKIIQIDGVLYSVANNGIDTKTSGRARKITSLDNMTSETISFPATGYEVDAICENNLGYFVLSGLSTGVASSYKISMQSKSGSPRFSPSDASLWTSTSGGVVSDGTATGQLVCFPGAVYCMISAPTVGSKMMLYGVEYWVFTVPLVTVTGAYAYMKYKEV